MCKEKSSWFEKYLRLFRKAKLKRNSFYGFIYLVALYFLNNRLIAVQII
jgi:hypothetical protein